MAPIFPPVRRHLEALWEQAEGKTYIFEQLRKRESTKRGERGNWKAISLREQLRRMIVKAGFRPWPKLWQNLRSSAGIDLLAGFPPAAVLEWIGHTADVVREHYFPIRHVDAEKATNEEWGPHQRCGGPKSGPVNAFKDMQRDTKRRRASSPQFDASPIWVLTCVNLRFYAQLP